MNEDELRAAGFSDDEIRAYLAQNPGLTAAVAARDNTATQPQAGAPAPSSLAGLGLAGLLAGGAGAAGVAGARYARPAASAQRRIARAVEQSGGRDALMGLLGDFEQAGRGKMVTLGDLSIPLGEQGTDFVATNRELARAPLIKLHQERQRGVPERLLGDVQQLSSTGYQSPEYLMRLSKQSQADFAASPSGYEGLRAANPALNQKRVMAFLDPLNKGNRKLHQAWADAASVGAIGPLPAAGNTSFETMQNLKERLDGLTTSAFNKGDGDLGRRLAASRDALVDMLEHEVPNYREVSATYARFGRHQAAVEAGLADWNAGGGHSAKLQLPDIERKLADMTPEQREAYRRGVVGGYIQDIENAKTNRNLANELMARSAVMEKKLELIFGSEKAFNSAVKRYGLESSMSRMGGYLHGSQTARRTQAAVAAGADVGETAVETIAHSASPRSWLSRLLPKWYAGQVARNMEPAFTATGSDAVRAFLKRLPK